MMFLDASTVLYVSLQNRVHAMFYSTTLYCTPIFVSYLHTTHAPLPTGSSATKRCNGHRTYSAHIPTFTFTITLACTGTAQVTAHKTTHVGAKSNRPLLCLLAWFWLGLAWLLTFPSRRTARLISYGQVIFFLET